MNKKIKGFLIGLIYIVSFLFVFFVLLLFTQYFGQRVALATNILVPQFFWINVFYPSDSYVLNSLFLWAYQYFVVWVNLFFIVFLFWFFFSLKSFGVFPFFKSLLLLMLTTYFWLTSVINSVNSSTELNVAKFSSATLILILLTKYFLKLYSRVK